ncbi:MAG: hypothetical protein HYV41_04335 [Candidatus Magasanikbacteria bacterium]|nr:hypothetical protein [Candidatus Magasanikbacteria bacterium]
MKITLCYSMQFADKVPALKTELERLGHDVYIVESNDQYLGKNSDEQEEIKLNEKYNHDAMRNHLNLIQHADAILILNFDKNGTTNYIGGNVFLEMGVAYFLRKQIFLLNPIPEVSYETEIKAMKPIIINQDLTKIKNSR